MLVLVKANVLAVGLEDRSSLLQELPIRVMDMQTGFQAGRSLKNENVNSIISRWNLPDSPNGQFVRAVRSAKPYLLVIVVIDAGNTAQEIAARSTGAAAVLSDDESNEIFRRTIAGVLGIDDVVQKLA
ncbi:MAG: hypothetical protein PHP01_05665 [Phycisphaerae bacterium]|nr:hypothetical protein [Phycisphaerae bacterium]